MILRDFKKNLSTVIHNDNSLKKLTKTSSNFEMDICVLENLKRVQIQSIFLIWFQEILGNIRAENFIVLGVNDTKGPLKFIIFTIWPLNFQF